MERRGPETRGFSVAATLSQWGVAQRPAEGAVVGLSTSVAEVGHISPEDQARTVIRCEGRLGVFNNVRIPFFFQHD